jgi:soluble lytic murein transglycosylase-like protein
MRKLFVAALLLVVCYSGMRLLASQPASATTTSSSLKNYQDLARQDAEAAGIPANLFIRQINQESGFDPVARGQSGEIGIAQFMPQTAAGLGLDPHDPVASLKVAAQLMATYYQAYGRSYARALAGYNCGGGCLARAVRLGGAAAWGCYIPNATQRYIRAIMGVVVCQ